MTRLSADQLMLLRRLNEGWRPLCGCRLVKRAAHLSAKEWSELTMGQTIPQTEISCAAILPKLVAPRLAPWASLDHPNQRWDKQYESDPVPCSKFNRLRNCHGRIPRPRVLLLLVVTKVTTFANLFVLKRHRE
jgi:hypothetical protein